MFFSWILLTLSTLTTALVIGRWSQDRHFQSAMLIYAGLICVAALFSLQDSLIDPGGNPNFSGGGSGSDGESYFVQARLLAEQGVFDFRTLIRSNYFGYQVFLAMLFSIFGIHLVVGVTANLVMLLLSLGCLHRATFLLTASRRAATLSTIAMMLTTANVFYALVLLKEPALGLAFSLVLLAITKAIAQRGIGIGVAIYFLVALAIIISMRATVLLFLPIIFAFTARLLIKRRAHFLWAFIGLLVLAAPVAQNFTVNQLDSDYLTREITENSVIAERFERGGLDTSGVAGTVASFYGRQSFPVKVALFPIPTAMQLVLPFNFWSNQFMEDHSSYFLALNLNIIWILFVAPWFLLAVINIRRTGNSLVSRFLLAAVFYYIVVAIIYAGLIPRYGTPALFFAFPAVGLWWARARENEVDKRRANRFFMHYYAVFVALALAYMSFQLIRG